MRTCKDMPYHIGIVMKLYPSHNQRRLIAVNAGAERAVYNLLVATRNEIYRLSKTAAYVPSDRERIEYLRSKIASHTAIENTLPYLYGKDIDCQVIANAMMHYNTAWKNMKERHTGVPVFHKKSSEQRWNTNGHYSGKSEDMRECNVRFEDPHHICLPKLGRIRCDGSPKVIRKLMSHTDQTRIGTVTISRDAVGEYWVSLQISSEKEFVLPLDKTGAMVGIDLNLLALVNDSDGGVEVNPRFRASMEDKLRKTQRKVSRRAERAKADGRKLGDSRNYQKARRKLAYLHRKAARQRDDYLNCISLDLVENQDLIAAEDLQVRNMLKNHCLAKAISDAGWRILLTQLQQKGEMYGRTVILVPPQNTTQTCSVCGHVMKGDDRLKLSDREWTCPQCGTHHDRDQNSGRNILMKGLKILNEAS